MLDELLLKKEEISTYIVTHIREKCSEIGIEVTGGGIKDIVLPGEIKDILNQVLIAEKKAQANIITRREETASTRSLLNTAKLMEENAVLYRLKELEFLEKISDKISQISLTSGLEVIEQLRKTFVPEKK
jgi:regulator of protease activity HflC (stomatin/prohibitin superfamily)